MQRREFLAASAAAAFCPFASAETPKDSRPIKTLNDYFPMIVPKTLAEWEVRRQRIREQILVATGLWPMPKRDCAAIIHSPTEREHYTIEKVYFASRPGHYVTGNLYKPKDLKTPRPGILFAHGHWANGRFYEAPANEIKNALATKAEATEESAKYPLQALPATLARRGYVVFAYDMVGYTDSTAIGHVAKSGVPHPNGFADVQGELRLQSLMGLQTFNSLAALDFLESLPMVDAKKIGMTGASGGGTQTFITAAIDNRIAAAVPAVMVSTAMQGGCVCENCSLLRVGTGNVEFAALMAPRPMALTAANDWTKEIMTKGFPELQSIYALYGKKENVSAKAWLEYPHNYNQKAREYMYAFFAKHFEGKDEAVSEPPFVPVPPKKLSVYDEKHPRPKDELNAAELRRLMTAEDTVRLKKSPSDIPSLNAFHDVTAHALVAMLGDLRPNKMVVREAPQKSKIDDCNLARLKIGRDDEADVLTVAVITAKNSSDGKIVIWIHPDGIASLFKDNRIVPSVCTLLEAGYAILTADLFGTGELKLVKPRTPNAMYAGFTFGYNRTLLAQRVHDIHTLMTAVVPKTGRLQSVRLVGWGAAGPWAALARCSTGTRETFDGKRVIRHPTQVSGLIERAAFDLNQFDFASIQNVDDEMMLPGALKYGGMSGLLTLTAPGIIAAFNAPADMALTHAAYNAAGAEKSFVHDTKPWSEEKVLAWLM